MVNQEGYSEQDFSNNQPVYSDKPYVSTNFKSESAMNSQDPQLIYQLTSSDAIIEKLKRDLRGEVLEFDDEGRPSYKRPKWARPLLNDRGVQHILSITSAHTSHLIHLGNINDNEMKEISENYGHAINSTLGENYYKFEMHDVQNYRLIKEICENLVFIALSNARGGSMQKFLQNTHESREINRLPEEQNKKFLGIIPIKA